MKTVSNFDVIGKVQDGDFRAYEQPEHRRAEPGEVVTMGGHNWELRAVTGNRFQATSIDRLVDTAGNEATS